MSAWRPIATAPKDGTAVILWALFLTRPRTGHYSASHRRWIVHYGRQGMGIEPPSHWQPLPPPPEEKK